ncbi:MAG: methyltransferase domain-containing protein [Candidatus Sungbacteria bacterium]|nr:methyltransferase domain-containing protein [Candidatus Sungbacteria bacterium]
MERNPVGENYDRIYGRREQVFGGGKPHPLVAKIPEIIQSGQVLEFGAGQGRNSIYLAEHGLRVIAVDLSSAGIETIQRLAEEKQLPNLHAEIGDARNEIEGEYDAIVSTFMLQHLSEDDALRFIERVKLHTKIGGVNAITAFTKDGDLGTTDANKNHFYPNSGQLKELYTDWEILDYGEERRKLLQKYPDGSAMFNMSAELLARKLKHS